MKDVMYSIKLLRLAHASSSCRNSYHSLLPTDSKKRRTWISYSLLVFPAASFALGYWQIQRRKWKIDLLEKINSRIPAKPIQLPHNVVSSSELPEFTHILVRGHFDHSHEVVIGPRSLIEDFIPFKGYGSEWAIRSPNKLLQSNMIRPSASGYFIVTPFYLEDRPGTSILVNRGWVPYGARDPIIRPDGQVEGVVELSGYIRYQEKPPTRIFGSQIGSLTCLDHANQNPHIRYPCRQIDKMSNDLKTLPIFLDADYESSVVGGPVGGQTRVVLRNEHASYIFTWFSLGTIGLGMWIYFFIF
ncbi:Surfeit locus protein 1 [Schistosoma japonicum]|nr:Surfeit locus protein 1 [Schistosoma japonicum]